MLRNAMLFLIFPILFLFMNVAGCAEASDLRINGSQLDTTQSGDSVESESDSPVDTGSDVNAYSTDQNVAKSSDYDSVYPVPDTDSNSVFVLGTDTATDSNPDTGTETNGDSNGNPGDSTDSDDNTISDTTSSGNSDTSVETDSDSDAVHGTETDTGAGIDTETVSVEDTATEPIGPYVIAGDWRGHAWTGTGRVTGGTISDIEGVYSLGTDALCVEGIMAASYDSLGLVGFNVSQSVGEDTASTWYSGVSYLGIYIDLIQVASYNTIRVELLAEDGTAYCTEFTGGTANILWSSFSTDCWLGNGNSLNNATGIKSVQVYAAGTADSAAAFSFCINDLHLWAAQ